MQIWVLKSVNSDPLKFGGGHEIFVLLHCQPKRDVTTGIKEKNCEY